MARKSQPDATRQANGEVPPGQVPKLMRQPRQRSRSALVLGALVVAGGAALAFHTVNQMSHRESVVVVARDVALGQPITAEDVSTAMVGVDQTVATVRGEDLRRVIGMRAASDLMRGMLVQSRMVTDQVTPQGDQQLIPIAVKPSRLPARGLHSGDRLLVVLRPEGQAVPDSKQPSAGIEAVVDQAKGPDNDGLMVVDVLVSRSDGPRLAALAADGQVALALNPRRP
ncbi:SAF domain-containing protein [Nonomuraea angiospora]|uniref:SAF domain-containing protein n=1 Tax=Nonomuraea angiospora TaxID=46172 RepID=UPI0029A618A9|nr:SAF domain-containing protein [Nonomuraea angiospora]MDX3099981.1 SAF domain-containing protein [Nonomuraea angiospora]